jgi:hypothetical protein
MGIQPWRGRWAVGSRPSPVVVLGAILVQAWFSRRMFWRGILR